MRRKFRLTLKQTIFLGFVVLLLLFFIFHNFQRILVFVGICAITGLSVFFNYKSQLPFDLTPVFFFSVLISYTMGFYPSVLFIIIAGIIPSLPGGKIDANYFLMLLVIVSIVYFSPSVVEKFGVTRGGLILAFTYGLMDMTSNVLFGEPSSKEVLSFSVFMIVNAFYFIHFGERIVTILKV